MKTQDWIDLLARGAGPAPRAVALRRLLPVALLGVAASAVLALVLLGAVPRAMFATPAPWFKLAYATALALAAGWLTARLARPLSRTVAPTAAVAVVLLAVAATGVAAWGAAPAADRWAGLFGHSWSSCPWNVFALSLPALAGTLWALRGLAPTQPRRAGFAAGLTAGAIGAFGYALSCTEQALSFVALWYSLGMVLSALLGAGLGPRVLRW